MEPAGHACFLDSVSIDHSLHEFDLFRSDFAYTGASMAQVPDVNYDPNDPFHPNQPTIPWSMRPLIVSAGPDGEFGVALNPWSDKSDPNTEQSNFNYRAESPWPDNWVEWNIAPSYMGSVEYLGRTGVYQMIDPYMRNFVGPTASFNGLLPGQAIPGSDATEARADNLSSYSPQVQ